MLLICLRDRPAAWVTARDTRLLPPVAVLEPDHPDRRWVACLAFFAQDIAAGDLHGAYTASRANHFVRCALMPDLEFLALADHADAALAEYFNVPLEQVAEKRIDLRALGLLVEQA